MKKNISFLLTLALIGIVGVVALFGYGVYRYGSVAALTSRVQSELASLTPNEPVVVPTFVPEVEVNAADFAAELDLAPATILPTPVVVRGTDTPMPLPTVESEPTLAATQAATETPTPTLEPTATPVPIYTPALSFVNLTGYQHNWQTWNNCGPATIATYLSYLNKRVTQEETASQLKPNEKDKNVRVEEIVSYVESRFPDLIVTPLMNGSPETLRILLSNDFPVMLQTWLEEDPDDGMGHYRFLTGHDAETSEWIVSDSYVSTGVTSPYSGIRVDHQKFIDHWLVFDNIFILIYEPEEAELVQAIIGEELDPEINHAKALLDYSKRLQVDDKNPFVWHTMGDLLLQDGRYEQAAQAYDQARGIGLPWRMFWYSFGIFETYAAVGRYDDLIELADATIDSGGPGEEIHYWKGVAHRALGDEAAAQKSFRDALWWNPTHQPSLTALNG